MLERAKQMLDEDMDDAAWTKTCNGQRMSGQTCKHLFSSEVKHMNQMMLYSKIVTIRDAQIQEK